MAKHVAYRAGQASAFNVRPLLLCVAMLLILLLTPRARAQAATAVPHLDFNQFTGEWFELARLPIKAERKCVGDVIALYTVGDKPRRFQVVNSCKSKAGYAEVRNGNGKMQDKLGDGKMKVSYTFLFSTKEWVLAAAADFSWALVGSPNHKNLWIFARKNTLPPEVLADIRSRAAAQGFDATRLISTPQSH